MLKINLVPKKLKDEFKMEKISMSLNKIMVVFLIFVFFSYIALLGLSYYLKTVQDELDFIVKNTNKDSEEYEKEVIEINTNTQYISEVQSDYTYWSKLYYSIGQTINKDLRFNSISIDKEASKVSINGHAATRQSLLDFKDQIEKNIYLSDIVFPIKTLFEKEDIDFSINATISSYEFNEFK